MPRGGRRPGAGRKRNFSDDERCEIARAYRVRMQAAAAADVMARDPELQRRRKIDRRMRELAQRHMLPSSDMPRDEDVIWFAPRSAPRWKGCRTRSVPTPTVCALPQGERRGTGIASLPIWPRNFTPPSEWLGAALRNLISGNNR
jgi:hypothetical protein